MQSCRRSRGGRCADNVCHLEACGWHQGWRPDDIHSPCQLSRDFTFLVSSTARFRTKKKFPLKEQTDLLKRPKGSARIIEWGNVLTIKGWNWRTCSIKCCKNVNLLWTVTCIGKDFTWTAVPNLTGTGTVATQQRDIGRSRGGPANVGTTQGTKIYSGTSHEGNTSQ